MIINTTATPLAKHKIRSMILNAASRCRGRERERERERERDEVCLCYLTSLLCL